MPIIKPEYAIYCYTGFGPRFGGGADIHISDLCDENRDSYVNFPSSFMCPEMSERNQQTTTMLCGAIKGNSFRVKEYEVYRVYYWRIYLLRCDMLFEHILADYLYLASHFFNMYYK